MQSIIIVRVSLSFASWKGADPQTSMYRITPRLQMSAKIFQQFSLHLLNVETARPGFSNKTLIGRSDEELSGLSEISLKADLSIHLRALKVGLKTSV